MSSFRSWKGWLRERGLDECSWSSYTMIIEHRRYSLQDISGRGNDIDVELNWNKNVDKNRYIKFQLGNKESIISYEHLWTILFSLATDDKQEKMLPVVMQTVKNYSTMVQVKAKNNIVKNQIFEIPMSISVDKFGRLLIKP